MSDPSIGNGGPNIYVQVPHVSPHCDLAGMSLEIRGVLVSIVGKNENSPITRFQEGFCKTIQEICKRTLKYLA